MVDNLLKSLNFSRESCTLCDGHGKFDAAIVCHEVRYLDTSPGEHVCVTFTVSGHRVAGSEPFAIRSVCHLRSLQLDTAITVKVWAAFDNPPTSPLAERRACGEARIPLKHVASRMDGSLYHTWVNLESAGLNDSVASMGYMGSGALADNADAFAQAIMSGPRQLSQPKACISLCRAEDLSPDGQILWAPDLPRTLRLARWGPLLRSQQQHAVMCAAQHLQGSQLRSGQGEGPQRLLHLKAQAQEQAREMESLQEQLQSLSHATTAPTSAEALDLLLKGGDRLRKPSMTLLEERAHRQVEEARGLAQNVQDGAARRGREAEAQQELDRQRAVAEQLRDELHNAQVELSKLGDEANNKIEAANVRIRSLRRERDEALQAIDERKKANQKLQADIQELEEEKTQLNEQKEALIRIVEDLHMSCSNAGLPSADRASIDSITGFKLP